MAHLGHVSPELARLPRVGDDLDLVPAEVPTSGVHLGPHIARKRPNDREYLVDVIDGQAGGTPLGSESRLLRVWGYSIR